MVLGTSQACLVAVESRARSARRAGGFTLVELMVTLAVAAVLAMIAAPSFERLILSNRLSTTANAVVNSINLARLDAIKLNSTTQFCGTSASGTNSADTLGTACGTQTGAVFSLPQAAPGSAATASQVQAAPSGLAAPVQISSLNAVRFSGQGFGYTPSGSPDSPYQSPPALAVLCVPQAQLPTGNQRIISMTAGSIVATASSTGACP